MTRLAVPIVILLLMLFAGAVWLLAAYVNLPQVAGTPSPPAPAAISEEQAPPGEQPGAAAPPRAAATQPGTSQGGSFDVARIDPQGTSVFAGRAEPGSTVTIMGDGQAVGTTEADENGEWTFATEHPFASANPKLALSVKSAAETRAEKEEKKARQTQVAGSLQTAEPAAEERAHKSAGTIASDLLKDFEGIVAAARTEAEQKKQQAAQNSTETGPYTKPEARPATESEAAAPQSEAAEKLPAKSGDSAAPGDQKPEKKVALAEPPPAAPPPAATANAPETTAPSQQSTAPPAHVAATTPEMPAPRKSIPVPITFVFNETTFTADGHKAVELLLEYLQLKHFPRVSMTGHADERGTREFNMELSRERLDAVAAYLRKGGYEGELSLVPKGETEPFTGVDRSQYSGEELYQLDRRVELTTTP